VHFTGASPKFTLPAEPSERRASDICDTRRSEGSARPELETKQRLPALSLSLLSKTAALNPGEVRNMHLYWYWLRQKNLQDHRLRRLRLT
jgi:hypothetical protein